MPEKVIPTPHIEAKLGDIAETVFLPGDPLRAKFIADNYLENAVMFNSVRNMLGFTGYYKGKRVSVMGSGMGCASMGIYSYELMNIYGCKNLIRIGTAGALNEKIKVWDIVIGMGACTNSNYVKLFGLPGDYSCICSYELLKKAVASAEKVGANYHVGNVLSSDMFYAQNINNGGKTWAQMGVLAVEMETAALYSNAAAAGANAISIFTISDSDITGESTTSNEREKGMDRMIKIALDVI